VATARFHHPGNDNKSLTTPDRGSAERPIRAPELLGAENPAAIQNESSLLLLSSGCLGFP
jgi:hypothetical protein